MTAADPPTPAAAMNVPGDRNTAFSKEGVQVAADNTNNLTGEIASLQKRVDALEKSDKSFWKKLGMVLGIIGGIIAIPKGVNDFWVLARPSPDVRVVWGPDVSLSYDTQTRVLTLVYGLSLSNSRGSAEDLITSASVKFDTAQPEPFYIAASQIRFESTNQQTTKIPLTIPKGEAKDLLLYANVTSELSDYSLANPGPRETEVSFILQSRGKEHPITRRFCLHDINSEALKRIQAGQPWAPSDTSCDKG